MRSGKIWIYPLTKRANTMKKTILLAAVAAFLGTQTTTLYAKFEDDDKGAVYATQATKTEIQKPALPASLYAESNEGTQDDWTTT